MSSRKDFKLVIDRTRSVGGEKGRFHSFEQDVTDQSHADIRQLLQNIVIDETDEQDKLGNPFNRLIVDGQEKQGIQHVKKKIVVTFGNTLDKAIMMAVEKALIAQWRKLPIKKMYRHDGGGWEIIKAPRLTTRDFHSTYYPEPRKKGDTGIRLNGAQDIKQVQKNSLLVLSPRPGMGLDLASWMNHAFVRGSVNNRKGTRTREPRKLGFMAAVSQSLRRRAMFKEFTIRAGYSKKYMNIGESWPHGTPYISIVVKSKTSRKRIL